MSGLFDIKTLAESPKLASTAAKHASGSLEDAAETARTLDMD
jgi:hypothetical protein